MDIKLVNRGNEGELYLTGRIDANNAEEMGALLLEVAERFPNVTLNLRDLSYISSAGLRILKKLYTQVRKNGGVLAITEVSPYVAEVFEMTGFSGMLRIK